MARALDGPCTQCGEPSGKQAWCGACKSIQRKDWAVRNPGYWRPKYLKSKYGITPEQYDALSEAQGHLCKACGGQRVYRGLTRLVIDHCHETGAIRGLLCDPCNLVLGLVEDDSERLTALTEYLSASRG